MAQGLAAPRLKTASTSWSTSTEDAERIASSIGEGYAHQPTASGGCRFKRRTIMATYIVLLNFTDQGVRNVKDTTKRAEAFSQMAKKLGVTVKSIYWTLGQYDVVATLEAPDTATVTAVNLSVGALGNVRTQTLPAFSAEELGGILGKMP
jgi:uncharacterized protein with GYD domain